jgi:hypothetical protein
MTIELVGFTYESYFEELKIKYSNIYQIITDLKWDVRKYNS